MNSLIARWTALVMVSSALVAASGALAFGAPPSAAHAVTVAGGTGAAPELAADAGWGVYKAISIRGQRLLLTGLDPVSASDAWVSGVEIGARSRPRPLIEHWDGRAWKTFPLPGAVAERRGRPVLFQTIGASSRKNVWMFGLAGRYAHLRGKRWITGHLPRPKVGRLIVDATAVFRARDVWAFGNSDAGTLSHPKPFPYAARFDGTRWRAISVPGRGLLTVSAISADDIWGITTGRLSGRPKVVHWNGTSWRVMATQPILPKQAVSSILALSDTDVWLGSAAPNGIGGSSDLALHWDGTSWSTISPPTTPSSNDNALTDLVPDGSGGIWGLDGQFFGAERFLHYTAGAWAAPVPVNRRWLVYQLGWVPGTQSIWAIAASPGAAKALILLHGPVPR